MDPGHDYSVDPRDGHRGRLHPPAALAAPKPFQAQSTYQAEIGRCANGGSAGRVLQAGCEPSGSAAGPAAPLVKPGYLSQYTAASLPLQQRLGSCCAGRSSGSMAADSRAPGAAATALASRGGASLADACAVMSRFEGATTYGQMYTTAPGAGACATEELNRGTAKTSLHLPGGCSAAVRPAMRRRLVASTALQPGSPGTLANARNIAQDPVGAACMLSRPGHHPALQATAAMCPARPSCCRRAAPWAAPR